MRVGVLAAAALFTFAACTDDDPSPSAASQPVADSTADSTAPMTSEVPGTAPSEVLLRPVLQCTVSDAGATDTPLTAPTAEDAYLPLEGDGTVWCLVGPAAADGTVFGDDATAVEIDGMWAIEVSLPPDSAGRDALDELTERCYDRDATCPTGQLAITFGDRIMTAPTLGVPAFEGSLQISGSFDRTEAEALAAAINAA